MTSHIDAGLISIWQKSIDAGRIKEPNEERVVIRDIFNAFQKHADKIWQCNIQELLLIKRKFEQLEPSNSLRSMLARIDQTINIYTVAAKSVPRTVSMIKQNNIKDPDLLFEIAKICAQTDGWVTAENIRDFAITDQDKLLALAKLCAEREARGTTLYIRNFAISDQDRLLEIAKLCAKKDCEGVTRNIKNFGIDNQDLLFELAEFCAEQGIYATLENIRNFALDKIRMSKMIMICARLSGTATAECIPNFGIDDQNQLFEIAVICAQQSGKGTAKNIQKFGIHDQDRLFEIAKICAVQSGGGTAEYIQNFNITDPGRLFEIAKICAGQNSGETAKNIKSFNIVDNDQLCEIAEICAQQGNGEIAKYIDNFNITDQKRLFEIAKICAQKNERRTAKNIYKFHITNHTLLFEIAKICIEQNSWVTAQYIKNFGIDDQNRLFEIAKICAQKDSFIIAYYIRNFNITDQNLLFEIARICAQQNGWDTAEHIKNFNIRNRSHLFEIAKICARQNGQKTVENIKNFDIQQDQIRMVILSAIQQDPRNVKYWEDNNLSDLGDEPLNAERAKEILDSYIAKRLPKQGFETLITRLEKYPVHILRDLLPHLGATLVLLSELCTKEQIQKVRELRLIEALQDFRCPDLRWGLTTTLIKISSGSALQDITSDEKKTAESRLLELLKARLIQRGTKKNEASKLAQIIHADKQHLLKNAAKSRVVIEAFFRLTEEPFLNQNQLRDIIKRLIREADKMSAKDRGNMLLDDLRSINSLILMGETRLLTESGYTFSAALEKGFRNIVPLMNIDNFADKYFKTFGSSRDPTAITTYAAKISSLNDRPVIEALQRFVTSVLEGSFTTDRYNIEDNVHLRTIGKYDKTVLEKWRKTIGPIPLNAITAAATPTFDSNIVVVETNNYMDLLLCGTEVMGSCQRVDGNPGLNKGLLGYLLDGKNHILAIKTQKGNRGRILARCLLKLLWDGKRPVLFRERFYPYPINPEYAVSLNKLAERKAADVGIPLLSLDESGENYPQTLYALGGPAPFEYSDGSYGLEQNGKYSINGATFLKPE